ncbi:hypothetical protein IscW_ISCW023672 [Ixodes scapularis]|uniref:Uncharacterized protein n=1 Tax=Ixodes scapularis TaxID=6945 RepID=B7QM24_IXOSC|nr:hypothetical protein IscW_ISCW023672 [Ixodes scapularis]|eukprot:XP_002416229.1 hypothetical protein IscW_ISCW023672 [Ixodes scapularis]
MLPIQQLETPYSGETSDVGANQLTMAATVTMIIGAPHATTQYNAKVLLRVEDRLTAVMPLQMSNESTLVQKNVDKKP